MRKFLERRRKERRRREQAVNARMMARRDARERVRIASGCTVVGCGLHYLDDDEFDGYNEIGAMG